MVEGIGFVVVGGELVGLLESGVFDEGGSGAVDGSGDGDGGAVVECGDGAGALALEGLDEHGALLVLVWGEGHREDGLLVWIGRC